MEYFIKSNKDFGDKYDKEYNEMKEALAQKEGAENLLDKVGRDVFNYAYFLAENLEKAGVKNLTLELDESNLLLVKEVENEKYLTIIFINQYLFPKNYKTDEKIIYFSLATDYSLLDYKFLIKRLLRKSTHNKTIDDLSFKIESILQNEEFEEVHNPDYRLYTNEELGIEEKKVVLNEDSNENSNKDIEKKEVVLNENANEDPNEDVEKKEVVSNKEEKEDLNTKH